MIQVETKQEAIEIAQRYRIRARVISGVYLGKELFTIDTGAHPIELGGNERIIFDNKRRK